MQINKLPVHKTLDARSLDALTLRLPASKPYPRKQHFTENMTHIFFFFDVKRFYLAAQRILLVTESAPGILLSPAEQTSSSSSTSIAQHFDEVFVQVCRPAVAMGLKHHHQPAIRRTDHEPQQSPRL